MLLLLLDTQAVAFPGHGPARPSSERPHQRAALLGEPLQRALQVR
jgi:hypothetical protein